VINPLIARERIIPQRYDTADILRSPTLVGCYGLKPIPQTKDYSCGAAATATVLRYLGLHSSEHECMQSLDTNKVTGTSWYSIYKLLRRKGLASRPWARYPVRELIRRCRNSQPTLVEWLDWGGHWVVCVGYEPTTHCLVFADPAKPRSNFTCHAVPDFEKHWIAGGASGLYKPAVAMTADLPQGKTKPGNSRSNAEGIEIKSKDSLHMLYDWVTGRSWRERAVITAAEPRR
jgi:hypothetical protein